MPGSAAKRDRDAGASSEPLCAFCHEGLDDDDPEDDPLVEVSTGSARAKTTVAHEMCLWWCPDITQAEDLSWQNVGGALRRCARLKCAVCGEGHAPLGCKRKACKKNWHYPCAMEPTTGLVIYEDEYCVACPICHEVMVRRERKQQMIADEKRKAKEAAKATAKAAKEAEKAAAKASAAASKKGAAASSSASVPPAPITSATAQARAAAAGGAKAKGKGKAEPGAAAAPPPPAAAPKAKGKKALAPAAPPAPSAPPAPPPPAPPPLAPPPPPPPPPDPRMVAAESAIAALFAAQRCEDLPLESVRSAAGLPEADLTALLEKMDKENKLMVRAGSVYLI